MKNVLIQSISKVVFIALLVYTFGEFHINLHKMDAFDQAWAEGRILNVDVEFPLLPIILTFLAGTFMIILSFQKYRKSPLKLSLEEYEENDERERLITSKAAKSAYTSISYTAFIAIGIITIATSWTHAFPALPIYLFGTVMIIATIVYATIWCIEFKK